METLGLLNRGIITTGKILSCEDRKKISSFFWPWIRSHVGLLKILFGHGIGTVFQKDRKYILCNSGQRKL